MWRKKLFPILIVISLVLTSCSLAVKEQPSAPAATLVPTAISVPTEQPTEAAEPTAIPEFPLTITDGTGRDVEIKAAVQKVVSLSPSNTEILFAVGAGDATVANTKYCDYPEAAADLPKVGGFSADSISIETIVSLKPDLVLADAGGQTSLIEVLEKANIPVIALKASSFDDVYANIEIVGKVTGHKEEATELVKSMKARIAAVQEKIKDVAEADRPTVFWEVWDEPLMTAGPNTFISQMITQGGGVNLFADATEDYPSVSSEEVIKRNPDFVMGPDSMGEKLTTDQLASQPGWDKVNAVVNDHIVLLDGNMSSRPGPRIADMVETIAKALYADLFAK